MEEFIIFVIERNNPYSYTDPTGRAAVWIHYIDTLEDYLVAGFSLDESLEIAAGAAEPDLYRISQEGGKLGEAAEYVADKIGLDLEIDYEGEEAEKYYHEGEDLEGNTIDLELDYWNAVEKNNYEKMGNIEHAIGHDVGSGSVSGYHSYEIENNVKSSDHIINDVFSTRTDRNALNKVQYNRAKESKKLQNTQVCSISSKGGK